MDKNKSQFPGAPLDAQPANTEKLLPQPYEPPTIRTWSNDEVAEIIGRVQMCSPLPLPGEE